MSFGQIARFLFAVIILCFAGITASAQTKPKAAPIIAPPSQQKEFKSLVEARTKAQAEYDAAVIKLPEYVAFNAAKKALEAAMAKLPVKTSLDDLQAQILDSAFRNMAELKLSSREYQPLLDDKTGELTFVKIVKGGP